MTLEAQRRLRAATTRRDSRAWYRWDDPAYRYLMQRLERRMAGLVAGLPRKVLGGRFLEIGCGVGHWLRTFAPWLGDTARITGLDLLPERLREAHSALAGPVAPQLVCGTAADLPFATGSADLVLQSMVFSSIPESHTREAAAREIRRVLSPDGVLIWYDFFIRRPGNRDVRPMPKREIVRLFPGCEVDIHRATLAPPLTRLVAPHSLGICAALERLPFLRTHYLGTIRPI